MTECGSTRAQARRPEEEGIETTVCRSMTCMGLPRVVRIPLPASLLHLDDAEALATIRSSDPIYSQLQHTMGQEHGQRSFPRLNDLMQNRNMLGVPSDARCRYPTRRSPMTSQRSRMIRKQRYLIAWPSLTSLVDRSTQTAYGVGPSGCEVEEAT